MHKKQKIVTKNDILLEHDKISAILDVIRTYHPQKIVKINKYFNYKQFLDMNQRWLVVEHTEKAYPSGYFTPTGYAYVYIPDTDEPDPTLYSFSLLHVFKELENLGPVGWIFDFRGNNGGVIHSFLLGFLPILDEFVVNCLDRKNQKKMELTYDKESIYFRYAELNDIESFGTFPPFTPINIKNVNVLVDSETASCGELMTYLLKKQKKATIYGELTFGIPTWTTDTVVFKDPDNNISLQYPELLLDFSDALNVVEQFQQFKIVPDITKIPFKEFGIF
jgi:hypothetical protein